MARTLTMTFFILTLFSLPSQGQTDFRVMSYNVENLFDTGRPDGFTINYNNWQKSSRQQENGALRL